MKLTAAELAIVRSQGLYVTEKCNSCPKVLNQSFRYTIAVRPEVYCSAACRDLTFFANRHEAKKQATPGKCAYCGGSLKGKKRGALYCDDTCRMRHSRVREGTGTQQAEKSRTTTQLNQGLVDVRSAGQGNRITGAAQHPANVPGGVAGKLGSPVEVEQRISGKP